MVYPNLFRFDNGQWEDTSGHSGLGVALMGQEQIRQRRAAEQQRNVEAWQNHVAQGGGNIYGPLKGLASTPQLGPLPDPSWDAFFGAMQGKENAAQAQGGRFNFDERSFGNWKQEPLYKPTWNAANNQQSAVGETFRDTRGNTGYRRRQSSNPALNGLRNSNAY